MAFRDQISLQNYAEEASREFGRCEERLNQISGSFETRMDGHSIQQLVGSIVGTAAWLVLACVAFWQVSERLENPIPGFVFLGMALTMVTVMLIDEIITFTYYGRISGYRNDIRQLQNRVELGRNSIRSNIEQFMERRNNGWQYSLSPARPIPDEAAAIESVLSGMESLKRGVLQRLKTGLFFLSVLVVTGVGAWALWEPAGDLIDAVCGEYSSYTVVVAVNTICAVAAEVVLFILAKRWWSYNNCAVTNITLLLLPVGPAMFMLLVLLVALLIFLVVMAIYAVVVVAVVVIGGSCAFGMSSGG